MLGTSRPSYAACVLGVACVLTLLDAASARAQSNLPDVVPNDNRVPAGELRDGVLRLSMVARPAVWSPEGPGGPGVVVETLGEEGGPPVIPAPLIRVPVGTMIEATIRNDLADSTLWVRGLEARPADTLIAVGIAPGASHMFRFRADVVGTYPYLVHPGVVDFEVREREQMAGAIVVDAPSDRTDDRVFVINIWGEPLDSTTYSNAVAINGRSWPYTEPLTAMAGDTLRWRVVNGSRRSHPMHLHGFYYTVEARGDINRDTMFAPDRRRLVVTEDMFPLQTMRMSWVAERPGNWLFHCHLSFHVIDEARLVHDEHRTHSDDPREHMAGLVLGVEVGAPEGWRAPERGDARRMRLLVQEGTPRMLAPRSLGYVLQRDGLAPAPDSIEIPGTTLVLTRDQPTDITVVNHLHESTAVHWHGIELESWSDGVAGWSGDGDARAPAIMPGDSFVARLTLPRTGTFIYHTHLNDIEQVTSGLYGALLVLEPGETYDPDRDHVLVAGWDGVETGRIIVNGDSAGAPLEWRAGESHRLRFVNIGPAQRLFLEVLQDSTLASWRPLAKDGAPLRSDDDDAPARRRLAVGETFDAEVRLRAGDYTMRVRWPNGRLVYSQSVRVTEADDAIR